MKTNFASKAIIEVKTKFEKKSNFEALSQKLKREKLILKPFHHF